VNLHSFADALETHLRARARPRILVSDERARLLGTGGGIVNALPLLGKRPFVLVNSDSLWIEGTTPNLVRLARAFDPQRMDGLLLLATVAEAIGYEGSGDYAMDETGLLRRRRDGESAPFVYAGAAILSPALFADAPAIPFALADMFDRAERANRLRGLRLEGTFLHVGTPEAIAAAEQAMRRAAAQLDRV
jgi:MurNAc alpha-1-phosphate uridylyltransferase